MVVKIIAPDPDTIAGQMAAAQPETEAERKWWAQHQAERKRIEDTGRCLCGSNCTVVYDLGWRYGFECRRCA